MYVVQHKYKGYLSDNEVKGQYYSESINDETLRFDTEMEANLLCGVYEKAVETSE